MIIDQASASKQTSAPATHGADRVLFAIIALSTIAKLGLALIADSQPVVLDEGAYLRIARLLVTEHRFEGTFRPPLYPGFMAAFLWLGLGTFGIRAAQVVISALSVWLVYRLTSQFGGRSAARIAAALFAFNPVLMLFAHRLWSETLFIFFLLLAIALLLDTRGASRWRYLAAGVAFGLAGLTRPMILTFVPFVLVALALQAFRGQRTRWSNAREWRQILERFALLALACALVVVPWTIRNARLSGAFILVDTNAPFNLLVGSQKESRFVDKDDVWSDRFGVVEGKRYEDYVLEDPARAQDLAFAAALRNIRERPIDFVRKSWWEAGHLWTLDSFLLRHLRNGWHAGLPALVLPVVTIMSVLFFAALVLAGFCGLATDATPRAYRNYALLLLLHSTLLFGLTYSLSRYGVPLQVVLTVPAALFLAQWHSNVSELRARRVRLRLLVLLVAVLFVGNAWRRDLPLLKDMIVNQGSEHRFRMLRSRPVNQATIRMGQPRISRSEAENAASARREPHAQLGETH